MSKVIRPGSMSLSFASTGGHNEYAAAFQHAGIGTAAVGLDGRWLRANRSFCRTVGYSESELLRMTYEDITHPGDLSRDYEAIRNLLEGDGSCLEFEKRYIHKDGHIIPVLLTAALIRNKTGSPDRFLVQIQDMTGRRDAEERISLLASIVESTSDAVISVTPGGVVTSWNSAAETIYGYTASEMLGGPISVVAPRDRQAEITDFLRRVQNGERIKHHPTVRVRKDGVELDVSLTLSPIMDAQGNFIGISSITRDISVQKRIEQQMHTENELLAVTLASIGDGVIATDAQGQIALMNDAAEALTEWPREEAEGRLLSDVFTIINEQTREPAENPVDLVLAQGCIAGLPENTALITRTGLERPIADSAAPIRSRDGRILGAVLVFRDVTEERRREKALAESEARFRHLTENAVDIVFRLRILPALEFEYISPASIAITGYTPEELRRDKALLNHVAARLESVLNEGFQDVNELARPFTFEWHHKDGHPIWMEQRATPIFNESGQLEAFEGISRDITERRMMEERLRYLSLHDALTGLYNRASFEQLVSSLAGLDNQSVGVIICDADGLKLVNDSLGHEAGDNLLIVIAGILRSALNGVDMIARIGGDEFAAILTGVGKEEMDRACNRIRQSAEDRNRQDPTLPLSLSLGYSVGSPGARTIHEMIREADDWMYREKLNRRQSTRSAIVQTLMKAMETRDFATEGHADRMQLLAASLGRALGLSEPTVMDIGLLAQFHDIGKVGVPDRVLLKQGALTEEEACEMRRHCEKGYRIAQASPDLYPIADWILKHHEWWDGSGYPFGLKDEEIPLPCRILAIVDAFDAMTSDRPYRNAMTLQEALTELESKSGTQFDPGLVPIFIGLIRGDRKTAGQ